MKIKYIDHRPISIPKLKYYSGGVSLPSGDNILKVTDSEAKHLMKITNGIAPCWEIVKEEVKEEVPGEGGVEEPEVIAKGKKPEEGEEAAEGEAEAAPKAEAKKEVKEEKKKA